MVGLTRNAVNTTQRPSMKPTADHHHQQEITELLQGLRKQIQEIRDEEQKEKKQEAATRALDTVANVECFLHEAGDLYTLQKTCNQIL